MDTKQIAEEAAIGIYERYINQKMWTQSGTLTQGEFLAMMKEHIESAIEKATKPLRNEITMWEKKRDLWVEEREALSLATPEAAESRAAHASEV